MRGRSCSEVERDSRSLFYSDNEVQWRHFVEPLSGQKIEEHAVTDLDPRNDENRPSLTSGTPPVTDRQEVSSKSTVDEMANATTRGNNIGLWPANIPERMR